MTRSAPGWHLLLRATANLPSPGGIVFYEGIVETDRWFGPLFTNLRFTRTHVPVRFRPDFPLLLAQPVPRMAYSDKTLAAMTVVPDLSGLRDSDWAEYRDTIVRPNSEPNRPFGGYATGARRRRMGCPGSEPEQ
jgi:hypothetical protein